MRPSIVGLLVLGTLWNASAGAAPPHEGACPSLQHLPPGSQAEDAGPVILKEGMRLSLSQLWMLRELLPEEIWRYREVFFFEGMQMEMGPCHRVYPTPAFFQEATQRFAEKVRLDDDGNLKGYVAGLPFPPDRIDPEDPQAGVQWAWNFQQRYRGAGPVGTFRLIDMPSRIGSVETYRGEFFYVQTRNRADLVDSDYAVPDRSKAAFVAGGRFTEPFNARHLAWRQLRPEKAQRRYEEPDDTFVYVPNMRKMRRSATSWIDGLFTPRYTVGAEAGGGPVPFGTGNEYGMESIQPTAALNIAASEDIRRGFTGLVLRPNAYHWRYTGEREVVAPLNGMRGGYPDDPDRNFGPSGLSVADDRWEIRWAVVLDGVARRPVEDAARIRLYVDYQTQQPLYYTSRRDNGFLLDVGILVHRFSGDSPTYPRWKEDDNGLGVAYVFDPVAAAFYYVPSGGAGWRRESYDLVSVPIDGGKLRQMLAIDTLERRGR
jgi:hypothetical protein